MKPIHKIKELCNKNGDTFVGKKVLLYYIDESGEYNLCCDVARSLLMELCLNTHTPLLQCF